ncbi:alkaline phosphatase [Marinithermofilum abyssi]|uniref:Alkaline phosphatase n=1 Tax=Marinithermofilum abyssi TaxID=1571185 RepID=A0A8J2VJG6_9BACL|nr:alkaline phosphatase D family protein [Marinithermofilum abyssi]GGE28897.1 alkaline phosphatase [Marinithermofilum abyssi]
MDKSPKNDVNTGRRKFIKTFLAGSALVLMEQLSGNPVAKALANNSQPTQDYGLPRFLPQHPAGIGFPQTVAAGDPTASGAVLWTRVDPSLGLQGIDSQTIDANTAQWLDSNSTAPNESVKSEIEKGNFIMVEVAEDRDFKTMALRGYAPIWKDFDHVVKVDVDGRLASHTTYYYRFITKTGHVSRTGRFKTLAAEGTSLSYLRFAYISCQDYTNGYYHALNYAAQEEVDFVIHLGDAIYESVGDPTYQNPLPDRAIKLPSGNKALTIEDYRTLHRTYRTDAHLQKLHENHAVIAIWDDHEFANDTYYPAVAPDDNPNSDPDRRLTANQVWFEYTPARVTFDRSKGFKDSIRIYRSVSIGNLAELILTDQRLYRSAHPCGEETQDRYFTSGCPKMYDPNQSMLGASVSDQKEWFIRKVTSSKAVWKIWGNEVQFTPLKLLSRYMNLDAWDGFAGERKEITQRLQSAGVKNFIAITGDLHTFEAGLIKTDYDKDPDDAAVGVEFMVGSVTSSNLKELVEQTATQTISSSNPIPVEAMKKIASDLLGVAQPLTSALVGTVVDKLSLLIYKENPWLKLFNSSTHGYCILELTQNKATWTAYSVEDIKKKDGASKSLLFQCEVPRDEARIHVLKG